MTAKLHIVPLSIDDAIYAIHRKFADASYHDNKSHNARLAAGQMLIALRKRIEAGEAGDVSWWDWYESKFVRSRRDAERVMALASAGDPEAAAEQERRTNREAQQRHRETVATDVSRGRTDDFEEESAPASRQLPEHMRKRGLMNRAKEAEELALADDLAGVKITKEMRAAIGSAMKAWADLYYGGDHEDAA